MFGAHDAKNDSLPFGPRQSSTLRCVVAFGASVPLLLFDGLCLDCDGVNGSQNSCVFTRVPDLEPGSHSYIVYSFASCDFDLPNNFWPQKKRGIVAKLSGSRGNRFIWIPRNFIQQTWRSRHTRTVRRSAEYHRHIFSHKHMHTIFIPFRLAVGLFLGVNRTRRVHIAVFVRMRRHRCCDWRLSQPVVRFVSLRWLYCRASRIPGYSFSVFCLDRCSQRCNIVPAALLYSHFLYVVGRFAICINIVCVCLPHSYSVPYEVRFVCVSEIPTKKSEYLVPVICKQAFPRTAP